MLYIFSIGFIRSFSSFTLYEQLFSNKDLSFMTQIETLFQDFKVIDKISQSNFIVLLVSENRLNQSLLDFFLNLSILLRVRYLQCQQSSDTYFIVSKDFFFSFWRSFELFYQTFFWNFYISLYMIYLVEIQVDNRNLLKYRDHLSFVYQVYF